MPTTQEKVKLQNTEKMDVRDLLTLLPHNTTFGDIHRALVRIPHPHLLSLDEVVMEINRETELRLHAEKGLTLVE